MKGLSLPRPRTLDPLGVTDHPVTVDDPTRVAELTNAFQQKLAHIHRSFRFASAMIGDTRLINTSVERLHRAVRRRRRSSRPESRLHPLVEIVVSHHARKVASERTGEAEATVRQSDINEGARRAAKLIKVREGAPRDDVLRHHVEGLMALIQETTGKPVIAHRTRESVYDPHLVGISGEVIRKFFSDVDPTIPEVRLANIVRDARRKYAGKHMRFVDFFPSYGISPRALDGDEPLANGERIETFSANIRIYCP